jgi:hypothetical protein
MKPRQGTVLILAGGILLCHTSCRPAHGGTGSGGSLDGAASDGLATSPRGVLDKLTYSPSGGEPRGTGDISSIAWLRAEEERIPAAMLQAAAQCMPTCGGGETQHLVVEMGPPRRDRHGTTEKWMRVLIPGSTGGVNSSCGHDDVHALRRDTVREILQTGRQLALRVTRIQRLSGRTARVVTGSMVLHTEPIAIGLGCGPDMTFLLRKAGRRWCCGDGPRRCWSEESSTGGEGCPTRAPEADRKRKGLR